LNIEAEAQRITLFIREMLDKSDTEGIVVGLSGGIDSALTASLCVRAIGRERVLALILPCHSVKADWEDARLVAKHLEIKSIVVDLSEVFDVFLAALAQGRKIAPLAKANLKPRLRMCALYYYANDLNYLVAGTGNKSEDEIGYFTKYGDGGVDFVPIQHLYKHEVREMARFLGVPEKIVTRKPSAGLWEGQTDEDELSQQLGFAVNYDILDEMLENIINDNYDKNDERYQKFVALRLKNKHKLEAPPGLERL